MTKRKQTSIAIYPETKAKLVELQYELRQNSMDALMNYFIYEFNQLKDDENKLKEVHKK
jgi:hypothetical protein